MAKRKSRPLIAVAGVRYPDLLLEEHASLDRELLDEAVYSDQHIAWQVPDVDSAGRMSRVGHDPTTPVTSIVLRSSSAAR